MKECIKDDNGVLPGKTIFFCISKAHAKRMKEIMNAFYPEYHGELTKRIVSDDPRVHDKSGLLAQFRQNVMPRIALNVDMLNTSRSIQKGVLAAPQIPLPVRLFGLRLDKIEKAGELNEVETQSKEILKLKKQIAELPKQSIIIRDARFDLQRLEDDNFWNSLSYEKLEFLRSVVKPLFRSLSGVDFAAMRFEKDIVEVSLAKLSKEDEKFNVLRDSIIEEISELPLSINIVASEEQLIRQSQSKYYWATITEVKMVELIENLAPLMKLVNR